MTAIPSSNLDADEIPQGTPIQISFIVRGLGIKSWQLFFLSQLNDDTKYHKGKYSPFKINKFKGNQCKNNNKNSREHE